ncbi:hypothetical protein EOD39_0991 [Acipenser ruthenus]|uniref:Uncharacterized protein n=1 Tax=Acipenser ruthenus TaxID=7906 RepID=A0A444UI44_ACIRT|nr:uncharacterized protein C11orf98 homolog [Acipenser ruthenus]RXM34855.1 hypothetical protein EOD39_0991 [Acipenser ruthenus]
MSPPSGKINRPKTELGKNLFKRRRVLKKNKRKQHKIVGAIVDKELITIHHLKKRCSSARANITLSGKKKQKLKKQLRHMQQEKAAMDVEVAPKVRKQISSVKKVNVASTREEKKIKTPQDVEMNEDMD